MAVRAIAVAPPPGATGAVVRSRGAKWGERVLPGTLYLAMLLSSIALIEPSPHDVLMAVVAFFCLIAGVRIERKIVALIMLLLVWNVSGLLSLMNIPDNAKSIQYAATSFYLSIVAIIFASLFARDPMQRLDAMRAGYIASAVCAAILGVIGYFHLIPDISGNLEEYGRATGLFKDPNVFGPFLIWPILFIVTRVLSRALTLRDLGILAILLFGLLLSFSRGAWAHFALSATVLFALLLLSAPTPRERMRLIVLATVGLIILAMAFALLMSMESIRDMFFIRAQAIQSYDVGERGRFSLQQIAVTTLLENFTGVGPFEFSKLYGEQQHNVYLQGFMVYGWVGGIAYILMVVSTLLVGLRTALIATPWQPYLITAYATFVGEVGEGFIIDTDHWRHFFLLLGMVWGLFAATANYLRENPSPVGMRA